MNTPFRPQQIAIVGAGASGCLCAYFLLKAGFEVTIFDKGSPLRTLLPTGGGRCNLAHAEYDFKELAKKMGWNIDIREDFLKDYIASRPKKVNLSEEEILAELNAIRYGE